MTHLSKESNVRDVGLWMDAISVIPAAVRPYKVVRHCQVNDCAGVFALCWQPRPQQADSSGWQCRPHCAFQVAKAINDPGQSQAL